ncbi:MAG: tRNA (adenosine(37)-N6)-threonylcarbamoyltransferase complex ATPase subunit type 1 TsaE [Bacteroidota bacterium]|nr:tRNA (adenosine(37)-N6)-threonylcarbamoyltransferase complex ATPase subunit type 1 TsaE [Bacteroidota bacterium]
MQKWECENLDQLSEIATEILSNCKSKKIAFYGNLGAGKTTFIKELCTQLGVNEIVNSPSFTILNEYSGKQNIYHFDFYRIKNAEEIYELGYEEYFFSDEYVFIEWAEKIDDMLPDFFTKIFIETTENSKRTFICRE